MEKSRSSSISDDKLAEMGMSHDFSPFSEDSFDVKNSQNVSNSVNSRHSNDSMNSRHSNDSMNSRHSNNSINSRLFSNSINSQNAGNSINSQNAGNSINSQNTRNSINSQKLSNLINSQHGGTLNKPTEQITMANKAAFKSLTIPLANVKTRRAKSRVNYNVILITVILALILSLTLSMGGIKFGEMYGKAKQTSPKVVEEEKAEKLEDPSTTGVAEQTVIEDAPAKVEDLNTQGVEDVSTQGVEEKSDEK